MGLDGVELVMGVEGHFRISLSDEECSRVRSVKDLANLVVAELSKVERACPTARSFFELRRTAMTATELDRSALRPRTPLGLVAPRRGRRRIWRQLQGANPVLPSLEPSNRATGLLGVFGWSLFTGWVGGVGVLVKTQGGTGLSLGLILGLAVAGIWRWTFDHLSTEFPDGCAHLSDLARRITPMPLPDGDPEAEQRVLDDIRRITAEQLGLKLETVKAESRFVDDLRID